MADGRKTIARTAAQMEKQGLPVPAWMKNAQAEWRAKQWWAANKPFNRRR